MAQPSKSERRNLSRVQAGLPARYYLSGEHHASELEAFWYRCWVYACRSEALAEPGEWLRVEVGAEQIVLTRDAAGTVHGFHNTCRHRGSLLCEGDRGRFRNGRIVCPYHAWTYALDGTLTATPWRVATEDFRLADHSLYRVAAHEWGGFVFVNLEPEHAPPLAAVLGEAPERLRNWHPERLRVGHRHTTVLECNWKLFWENFSECYHCPGVHPELCRIVPVYGRGLVSPADDPDAPLPAAGAAPEPRLAPGAVTWSLDGATPLPWFTDLTEAERSHGHTYAMLLPAWFAVAHVDYLRSVRVLPRGPQHTELCVEWLFEPEVLAAPDFDLERAVRFGRLVVEQDARACELNQRGLRCRRHERGVLVAQEHGVRDFQHWILAGLGEAADGPD